MTEAVSEKRDQCQKTGAQILLQALIKEGVDTVFGYPGGAVIPIYDALYQTKEIKHILTRHEQGAVHAADGYARATGKPGVCIATSGPGATNLVTGIANAYMDSVPIVAITGQVSLELLGKDSFQEADITGITTPITKYNYLVKDIKELATVIREAFHIATTGRPGPVLIDISRTVTVEQCDFAYPTEIDLAGYKVEKAVAREEIDEAVKAIKGSKKPLIFVGGGSINAAAEVKELVKMTDAPLIYSLMGKSTFPNDDSHCLGMVGMHGTAAANYTITESDLVIGIGVRFDDRVTGSVKAFAPEAKIIHIDIDEAELNKNVIAYLPIKGDAKEVTGRLISALKEEEYVPQISEWLEKVKTWQQNYPLGYEESNEYIKPQAVLELINELTQGEAYIATEVGQNQMWAAQYLNCTKPRTFITSGGLGTMGFGFPAAIGVQFAHPEATVFDIAGDGSIQMNIQELATVVEHQLPLNIVILNNHNLGMVRQWQKLFFGERYSHTNMSGQPDFVKLAEAYGAEGRRVKDFSDLRGVLEEAINSPKAYVIDVLIDPDEDVFPMVPAGGALNNMLGR